MSEDRICLCALSGQIPDAGKIRTLKEELEQNGLQVELCQSVSEEMEPAQKAEEFNKALRSNRYAWIIDVSTGDMANLLLPDLDYQAYADCAAYFAGFGDCTCIVNALAACSGKKALLFSLMSQSDLTYALELLSTDQTSLSVTPCQQRPFSRHARICGGNVRCFLKLTQTGRMPDAGGGYLFLESRMGWYGLSSSLAHMAQAGVFENVRGIILGCFDRIEEQAGSREAGLERIAKLIDSLAAEEMDYFRADQIGSMADSKALWISANGRKA